MDEVSCHLIFERNEGNPSVIPSELSVILIDSTQFPDSLQILKATLQLGRDELNSSGAEGEMEGNFVVPTGHMEQHLGHFPRLKDANTRFETLIHENLELSRRHVDTCIGFVRFGVFLAVTFKVRFDGGGLNDAEID